MQPKYSETCRGVKEEDRPHLYSQHNVAPTHRHKSFSIGMSRVSTRASPHCITAPALSIEHLSWLNTPQTSEILDLSKPCQDTFKKGKKKRLKERKLQEEEEEGEGPAEDQI